MSSSTSSSSTQALPACIVLIYGLPASGKTLLTTSLVEEADTKTTNWIAVHFDDFYPLDTRSEAVAQDIKPGRLSAQAESGHKAMYDYAVSSDELFVLKEARHKVNSCIEHFISVNHLGCFVHSDGGLQAAEYGVPAGWDRFIECMNNHHNQPILNECGRLRQEFLKPTVLVLDDNMPLRSIRYEYYQLARKYQLGFMEVYVRCPLKVAKDRNCLRTIPITESTLETMEQSMEEPDPTKYHWEQRSAAIGNESDKEDFIKSGLKKILPLVEHSINHPELSLNKDDTTLKEDCRIANIDSYVHQADIFLRNCVSEYLRHTSTSTQSKESKVELAKKANAVRRKVLDEIRGDSKLGSRPLKSLDVDSPTSDQYRKLIEEEFKAQLR